MIYTFKLFVDIYDSATELQGGILPQLENWYLKKKKY